MNSESPEINFLKEVSLSEYTTIGLGGKARYFLACRNIEDVLASLKYCRENEISVQVFSGGSNIIFSDNGYDGLVMKIGIKGVTFSEEGSYVAATVKAGENWDEFVELCISRSLTGVECLSGIPGSAGAVPIQNVGAYGQEVKDVIVSVAAIERSTLKEVTFSNEECNFGYRQSRFKYQDKDKYIIVEVRFRFEKNTEPQIEYPELQRLFELKKTKAKINTLEEKLKLIRTTVLELRKGKSMVIDRSDPNSKSCGSFFINPVLDEKEFEKFKSGRVMTEIPVYKSGNYHKISAAWLIEQAGFQKGYIKGGVGISQNHSLALININGTTEELLDLADDIEKNIFDKFGIRLIREPVID